ncbi:MAG: nitrophenyl compound nitroreductase subunit ArsF family protein [Thermoguttaceae bacterium]
MKKSSMVGTFSWMAAAIGVFFLGAQLIGAEAKKPSGKAKAVVEPAHKVVACYFHRTVRCPTCKKIGAYIEEAVKSAYPTEIKDGRVKMTLVDFQDPKNKKLAETYKIRRPTLVVMDVHKGKVTAWKPAPKIWSLIGKKDMFFKYVQNEVRSYLEEKKAVSTARR